MQMGKVCSHLPAYIRCLALIEIKSSLVDYRNTKWTSVMPIGLSITCFSRSQLLWADIEMLGIIKIYLCAKISQ